MKSRNSEVKKLRGLDLQNFKTSKPHNLNSEIPKIIGGKTTALIFLLFYAVGFSQDTTMTPYCCYPPFVTEVVPPNIMILMDNSGSMADESYQIDLSEIYVGSPEDTIKWYGYFDPDTTYSYASSRFYPDPNGPWPGRILNWACMSRGDILRKALVGGAATSQFGAGSDPIILKSEGRDSWTVYYRNGASGYNRFRVSHGGSGLTELTVTNSGTPPINATLSTAKVQVDIPRSDWIGVIQQVAGEEVSPGQWVWRENAPRFGLFIYNLTWSGNVGGHIVDYIGGPVTLNNMCNHIQNTGWTTNTPLCETYFEIIHYFTQSDPHYLNGNYNAQEGGEKDPQYEKVDGHYVPVWCRRNFVLAITDGEPTVEQPIPNDDIGHLPHATGLRTWGRPYTIDHGGKVGGHFDEIAYYANTTDLRAPNYQVVADSQALTLYMIYCFGRGGGPFLSQVAKCGGFIERDNIPGPNLLSEWDADTNGVPDNYFEAQNGSELEAAIMKAITQMMATVSSASGVAVVTPGSGSGGATTQAQFYPVHNFATGELLNWIGTCQGLWLDPYGWIREDNDNPSAHTLHLQKDWVIKMSLVGNNVMIDRYEDPNGMGIDSEFVHVGQVTIEDLLPLWDGGEWLWNHTEDARTIKTFVDLNKNGYVDAGEYKDFTTANTAILRDYLNVNSDSIADIVIRYIRGEDFPGLRTRTANNKVWKLGDIINSGAVAVQGAIERYDFIYGDIGYKNYYDSLLDRRQVVYVGGNDGMLHCFNNGIPVELDTFPTPMKYEPGGYDLGEEMWSYIPYNLLPHLRWLTDKDYCHVYYVDLKPYVTDVQIFTPGPAHPDGWGTILIGGMRLGGMTIESLADTCSSAYFAIDVTDPDNQVPMWEFTDPGIGLTMCYPIVIKVKDSWFLTFGSGPANCEGESYQNANIYCLDLATGQLKRMWTLPDANSFVSNIFGADWGMDYTVDRIYFGDCYSNYASVPPDWHGKLYRILTNDKEDPAQWTADSCIFDFGDYPVTAEGSIATDDFNHLWLYFGTGRFFTDIDELDITTQRYIGIRDDTTRATTVAGLYDVTDVWVDTNQVVHYGGGGTSTFDALIDTTNTVGGWWRELDSLGERNLTTSLVFGGAVLFTTFVPTEDICSYGGEGYLWALYYRTGTAYITPFLDTDSLRHPESVYIGPGMPSEPSLYVTADQTNVFIQTGGGLVSPETGIPGLPKSGVIIWKGR